MNKRERIIIVITIIAGSIFLVDRVGGVDAVINLVTFNSAQEGALIERNKEYKAQIENIPRIREEFQEIERTFTADEERSPEYLFTEDLNRILKAIGQGNPDIKPTRTEPIGDVTEFEYLTGEAEADRLTQNQFRTLMRLLEEENFIVQQLDIQAIRDTIYMNVDLKVAKIQRVRR